MELPKISYDDLPESVKNSVDKENFSFESLLDQNYFIDFEIDWESISQSKMSYAKRLMAQRKYVEELKRVTKLCDSGKITEIEAQDMIRELKMVRDETV